MFKRSSINNLFRLGIFLIWLCQAGPVGAQSLPVNQIQLPPGFQMNVFSSEVPGARSMTLSPSGVLFVGTRGEGKVYGLVDRNQDGRADRVFVIAEGLNMPNGVAFRNGSLYVAEISRILRWDGIEKRLADPPKPVVLDEKLPKERHHGWKFIAFGPDGKLYVPIGAPCNICERPDPYETISRMNPDGTEFEIYARGVRNSVGFDWHPKSGVLWFTDNGRDWLGDELPPDELNRAPARDMNFGFPFCYGDQVPDPKYHKPQSFCAQSEAPALNLPAHVAPLGMRFYTGKMFPEKYRHQIFIAQHGSWNRSRKIGYQVILVRQENGKVLSAEPFASGWMQGQNHWGRPVDVQVMPDGALMISDDQAGALYRIIYRKP